MDCKSKRIIKNAAKALIIVLAYAYAGYKIATSPDIDELPSYFTNINASQIMILAATLLLMPLNWFIETWKWHRLIGKIEGDLRFGRSIMAVMTGVTVGTLTPNRAGEFAGRILFITPENRAKASYLTIFSDTGQFCATLIFGIIGLLTIGSYANDAIPLGILITIGALCGIVIVALYIKFDAIVNALSKTKFVQNKLKKYVPQCDISIGQKISTFALSMLRYIVFSFQFYLSLKFFGIEISACEAFSAISATYICTYLIPNIAAAELGIRTSFAITFVGIFTTQETAIALASLLIYIINVVIPIIIGGIGLIKHEKSNLP